MKKNVGLFLLGLALGSLIAAYVDYIILNKDEEEIHDMEKMEERDEIIYDEKEDTDEKVLVMSKDRYKKIAKEYAPGYADLIRNPYIINHEDFDDNSETHDKVTIYFYKEDSVLCDEDDEIFDDAISIIGKEALVRLVDAVVTDDDGDPDVVYVRNNQLSIDYEVIRDPSSYAKMIGEKHDG